MADYLKSRGAKIAIKMSLKVNRLQFYNTARKLASPNQRLSRLVLAAATKLQAQQDPFLRLMQTQIQRSSIVYDIGAYVGLYSLCLAQGGQATLIYAFEPNQKMFDTLCTNIALMGVENQITPIVLALGAQIGMCTFYISSYSPRSSLYKNQAQYRGNRVVTTPTVACSTIDNLVETERCKPPDAIKIDTEGSEYDILLGADKTLATYSPQLFIAPHGGNRDTIEVHLAKLDYNVCNIRNNIWAYK